MHVFHCFGYSAVSRKQLKRHRQGGERELVGCERASPGILAGPAPCLSPDQEPSTKTSPIVKYFNGTPSPPAMKACNKQK